MFGCYRGFNRVRCLCLW